MRPRPGLPLALLIVLLVAVPIAEVWLLIEVGQRIGLLPTVLILVAEAFLGAWLLRHEGSRAWRDLRGAFGTGRLPSGQLANAALILVGGVLLMLPGFLTDLIGFLFLLPWTRPLARKLLAFFLARSMSRLGVSTVRPGTARSGLIEGEVVADAPAEESPPDRNGIIRGEIDDAR